MKAEEAIKIIDDVTWQDNGRHYGKIAEARNMAKSALRNQAPKDATWKGYTCSAFIGMDGLDPKFAERRFYRCSNCRRGTAVQTNFCPDCGAKMQKSGDRL